MKVHLLLSLFCCAWLALGCNGTGNSQMDEFLGDSSIFDDFGYFGNSSIAFTPTPWDFGSLVLENISSTRMIEAKNVSTKALYIRSISVSTSNFSVIGDNCPRSPSALRRNQSCLVEVRFNPNAVGKLAAGLDIKFGDQAASSLDYTSSGSLVGTSVTPLTFTGLSSICGKTHNTMTLCWEPDASATVFQIFRVADDNLIWVKNVDNTSGDSSSTVVSGLWPSTSYTFRVRAIDAIGQPELNTTNKTDVTSANNPPQLLNLANLDVYGGAPSGMINQADSTTGTDFDIDGDAITYTCFFDTTVNGVQDGMNSCETLINEGGGHPVLDASAGTLSGWIPLHAEAGTTQYEFFITGTDPYGGSAADSFVATVLHGIPLISVTGSFTFPSNYVNPLQPTSFDVDNILAGIPGNDVGMNYSCTYDQVVDGSVALGTNCTDLPGVATFDVDSGVLSWTPDASAHGAYEFKVVGSNVPGSDEVIVVINVRAPFETNNLLAYWDAQFAWNSGHGRNVPFTEYLKDLWAVGSSTDGVLENFGQTNSSGWSGTGSAMITSSSDGPYRLVLDGVNDYVSFGDSFNNEPGFFFDMWLRPEKYHQKNKTILTNADGANGLKLKTTTLGSGQVELIIGERSYEDEVLADAPVGYWRYNERYGLKAFDASPNGLNGVYSANGVTYEQGGALLGDQDPSVRFNGTNGSMNVPYAVGTTITIEMWATASNVTNRMLWRTGPNGSGPDLFLAGGKISLNTWDGASNPFCNIPATANNGLFHHYVTVIDGATSAARLYYDGVLCGTASYRNPSAVSFTVSSGLSHFEWSGAVDEVAIYDEVLSEDRILAHYNARAKRVCRTQVALNYKQWNHLAAMYDGVDESKVFINGQEACTISHAMTYQGSLNELTFGDAAGQQPWKGSLRDFRLYSSGSAAEVEINKSATQSPLGDHLDLSSLGLKLWLRADALADYSTGDAVCFWNDMSGQDNHLKASATANCPLFFAGMLGPAGDKKPILLFNGSSHHLNFTSGLDDIRTVITVQKWTGVTGSFRTLLGHSSVYHWITGTTGDPAQDRMASVVWASPFRVAGSAYLNRGAAQFPQNITKPTTYAIYSEVTTGVTSAENLGSERGLSNRFFWGEVAEIFIFNTALSDQDRGKVEDYLAKKYNIP